MNAINLRRTRYGRYDRITTNGAHYRYLRWEDGPKGEEDGAHVMQLALKGMVEDSFVRVSKYEAIVRERLDNWKVEAGYFTKALDELRSRCDDTNLLAMSEEEVRDIFWKTEWCVRFHNARIAPNSGFRPKFTNEDIERFIEHEKRLMARWYLNRYGEPRPAGRPVVVGKDENGEPIKQRKLFDYPSPTTLRDWLRRPGASSGSTFPRPRLRRRPPSRRSSRSRWIRPIWSSTPEHEARGRCTESRTTW